MEKFYLRMLLTNRPDMQGYEDRRTINGVAHPTFKAASVAMGLLENDRELIRCLEEISLITSAYHLPEDICCRSHSRPKATLALWVSYADKRSIDYWSHFYELDKRPAVFGTTIEVRSLDFMRLH